MEIACKIGVRVFIIVVMVSCYPNMTEVIDQPSQELSSLDVVDAQLTALQNNNEPSMNAGIRIAYNFASPYHREEAGTFQKYKTMYRSRRYGTLVDNKDYRIKEHYSNEKKAEYFVFITDKFDRKWVFIFRLTRQASSPYNGCWMTDEVLAYADARALTGSYYKV